MSAKLVSVAWWEYSEKIRSKAFIVSLILLPAVIVALVVVPAFFATGADGEQRELAIVDEAGIYAATVVRFLEERFLLPDGRPNYRLRVITPPGSTDIYRSVLAGDSLVLRGEIEGYVILRSPIGGLVEVEYRTLNAGSLRLQERIIPAIREALIEVKMRARGIDPGLISELGRSINVRTFRVASGGQVEETSFDHTFIGSYMYMMMLFFIIMTSGQLLVRSMLEEKSNRIVEMLLSSVPARDIMGGKILGLGALGVTQLLVWGVFATVIGRFTGLAVIPLGSAILLSVYFVLGYLLYTALFVSAGAPLSTEQEAQQVTSLLSLGLVVPLALAFPVMQDPGSTLAVVLTIIPLFTPMMMAIRIPGQMPSLPEILLSLGMLGLSVVLLMRLAGRIFSASVLLAGKRLSFRELKAVLGGER